MARPKGSPKSGGRIKGTPNKVTSAFKTAVLNVFNENGGEGWLSRWAMENPTEFFKIAARLIPQEITGKDGGPIEMQVKKIERVIVDPSDRNS